MKTKAKIIISICDGYFVCLKLENQTFKWVFYTELEKYDIENEEELVMQY
jgi:hypothetical protein